MTFQPTPMKQHNGYDTKAASDAAAIPAEAYGPSMTIQSQAEDADINVIMKRFGITGKMPDNIRTPVYEDFEGIHDYRTALDAVNAAAHAFMEIPAEIRNKFNNDPQAYLEFCGNPDNLVEMRKLGLAKPAPAPEPPAPPAPPNKVEEPPKPAPST